MDDLGLDAAPAARPGQDGAQFFRDAENKITRPGKGGDRNG